MTLRRDVVLSVALLIGVVWAVTSSGVAHAKGGGPLTSYVAVTGPGLDHPWVLHAIGTAPGGYRGGASELFVNLATRLGVLGEGASAEPMSPPDRAELGPRFEVYFFLSCLRNNDRCRASVHEELYPFSAEGAIAYLPPGQERLFAQIFGRRYLFSGWFGVFEGDVVQQQLLDLGATEQASALPSSEAQGVSKTASPLLLVAAIVLILAFALVALAYRSRRSMTS